MSERIQEAMTMIGDEGQELLIFIMQAMQRAANSGTMSEADVRHIAEKVPIHLYRAFNLGSKVVSEDILERITK